jgi:hypothetical protein
MFFPEFENRSQKLVPGPEEPVQVLMMNFSQRILES